MEVCINFRYGVCSKYIWENEICHGVFEPDIDFVYAKAELGNQSTISDLLNSGKKDIETIIRYTSHDCVKDVFKIFCHYYLPPCNNSHGTPSSICQKECQLVQDKCQRAWDILILPFKDIEPVINCSDTSKFLFPVPHCCTGVIKGK